MMEPEQSEKEKHTQRIAQLLQELKDKDQWVRWKTIKALGVLGGEKAFEALLAALHDESVYVRFEAAKCLGGLCDPRAVDPLIQVLEDEESPKVRGQAARAWAI